MKSSGGEPQATPVIEEVADIEPPGAIYHVMNRGDHREPIFKDNADRQRFVKIFRR